MTEPGESEWPVVMIYVIFVSILLVMGLSMILQLVNTSTGSIKGDISEVEYALLSARILNSADCLAWEEPFYNAAGEQNWQVRQGVVDWYFVKQDRLKDCIKDTDYTIELIDLTDGERKIVQSEKPGIKIRDLYFVKIIKSGELHDGIIAIALFEQ